MKRYEFVSVKNEKWVGARFDEHREIISKYAAAGWRYVGFLPTYMSDYGKIKEMDLIFEKEQ